MVQNRGTDFFSSRKGIKTWKEGWKEGMRRRMKTCSIHAPTPLKECRHCVPQTCNNRDLNSRIKVLLMFTLYFLGIKLYINMLFILFSVFQQLLVNHTHIWNVYFIILVCKILIYDFELLLGMLYLKRNNNLLLIYSERIYKF